MSSHALNDHEAALRAALNAAADGLEPSGDGLQRIQDRLGRPRPLPIAWAQSAWTRLSLRIPEGGWYAIERAVFALRAAADRFLPAPHRDGRGARLAWLRPLAAMTVGVSVVAAVVYTAISVTQVMSPASSDGASSHASGPAVAVSGAGGSGQTQSAQSAGVGRGGAPVPSQAGTSPQACLTGPSGQPTGSPAPSSPSPTSTPSQTASPTPSPTPTPSGSASPTPSASASSTPTGTTTSPPSVEAPSSAAGSGAGSTAAAHPGTSAANGPAIAASRTKAKVGRSRPDVANPCPSKTASPKPKSSKSSSQHVASPDPAGAALILRPATVGIQAPEVKARPFS
jgi:hypothetical protein